MQGGKVRAVVVNSGVANTSVGEQGFTDAQETMLLAAEHTGIGPEEICMCSTGLIGGELPMALIRSGLPNIGLPGKLRLGERAGEPCQVRGKVSGRR